MGDPAGVGLDITLAAWSRRTHEAVPTFFVLGDPDCIAARARALGANVPLKIVASAMEASRHYAEALPILPVQVDVAVTPGRADPRAGQAVIRAIETAVSMLREGQAAALVTNPINKHVLYQAGFAHPGHTEFLAELAGAWGGNAPRPVMMLACDGLRVVPVTIHVPLHEVPGRITQELIVETVETTARALRDDFGVAAPRLAVSGLNPHAGEGGAIGREEAETIRPAIERLRAAGHDVSGPYPADAMFHAGARAAYDTAIAMYHDQALIPIKTLAFDRAVNVTLGLPFVRTSPDHGTAYDIAGTGRASPTSLIEALKLAARIAERRRANV